MTLCTGRGAATGTYRHCCMMGTRPCPHLVENVAGRRWACGLIVELGSWDAVETDPRYIQVADYFGSPTVCRDSMAGPGQCCFELREGDDGYIRPIV